MQPDSKFAAAYSQGLNKKQFWEPIYEDSLDLIAKMPGIAANIYRRTYKGGKQIQAEPGLDWAGNLAHQMGKQSFLCDALRCLWGLCLVAVHQIECVLHGF